MSGAPSTGESHGGRRRHTDRLEHLPGTAFEFASEDHLLAGYLCGDLLHRSEIMKEFVPLEVEAPGLQTTFQFTSPQARRKAAGPNLREIP
jgi:hypothetical protein